MKKYTVYSQIERYYNSIGWQGANRKQYDSFEEAIKKIETLDAEDIEIRKEYPNHDMRIRKVVENATKKVVFTTER